MIRILILIAALVGLLPDAFGVTNVQAVLTFNATTLGAYATDAEIDASFVGPGTSTTPSASTFLAVTNWPYRWPYWFQIGGTNFTQASDRWVQWTPTNSGTKTIEYFAPGGGSAPYTNGWMQGFMRLDMTNVTGASENYDLLEMQGNPYCILQINTGTGAGATGMRAYAHANGDLGLSIPIERNKLYFYSLFRDPAVNSNCVCELFDPTNNYAPLTNVSGGFNSTARMPSGDGNTWEFWLISQYLPGTPPLNTGTNWFSSIVYGYGLPASPTSPPRPETNVIVSDNTYTFIQGSTVGVRGGIPARTGGTTIDVTAAPYGVDKGGVTNATTGINAALAAAASNDVVYLPAGVYNCATNGAAWDVAGVELRGELTNGIPASTIVGNLGIGHSASGNQFITLTNGGWKGSSNLVLSATNTSDGNLGIGDLLLVSDLFNSTNTDFIVRYDVIGGSYRAADQVVTIIGFNGYTVNISAPLVYYFTNASSAMVKTLNIPSLRPKSKMGIRDLRVTGILGSLSNTTTFRVNFNSTVDSYMTNVVIDYPQNYALQLATSSHFTIEHVLMQHALSVGTSRSGMTLAGIGSGLIHNNVFNDLSIGWQVQGGSASATVWAYNYYTNISDKAFTFHGAHQWFTLHEGEKSIAGNVVLGDGYFGSSSSHYVYRNWLEYTIASKRWVHHNQFVRNFLGLRTLGSQVFLAPRTSSYSQSAIFEDDFPHLGNTAFSFGSVPDVSPFWPGTYVSVNGVITNFPYDIVVTTTTNVLGTNLFNTADAMQRQTTNFQGMVAQDLGNFSIVFQDGSNTNRYWYDDLTTSVLATAAGPTNITLNQTITVSNGWKMFVGGAGAYNQLQSNTWSHIRHANTVYTNGVGVSTMVLDPITLPLKFPDSLVYSSKPGYFGTNVYPADGLTPIPAETWFQSVSEDTLPRNIPRASRIKGIKLTPR